MEYHSSESLSAKSALVKLEKKYKIKKTIEEGSTARVVKARIKKSNEKVAIKIFPKSRLDEKKLSYIQEEIKIRKSVDHPNIVKLYEAGSENR